MFTLQKQENESTYPYSALNCVSVCSYVQFLLYLPSRYNFSLSVTFQCKDLTVRSPTKLLVWQKKKKNSANEQQNATMLSILFARHCYFSIMTLMLKVYFSTHVRTFIFYPGFNRCIQKREISFNIKQYVHITTSNFSSFNQVLRCQYNTYVSNKV